MNSKEKETKGKKMKKQLIIGLMALSMSFTTLNADRVKKENGVKILVVELDKEGEDNNKGGTADILKAVIHIGNNDEVQFVGKNTLMATPITIVIKNSIGKIKKSITDVFTIKSSELAVGDTVTITNRRDVVLAKKKVVK